MKKSLLAAIILLFSYIGFAQNSVLVQSNEKGLYVTHTVSPKENFYSIGRLYNISPKEIAAFNSLFMDNGLSVGQVVRIPLTAANFSQTKQTGKPVYYVVGEKEGLYRVSVKNNKVLMVNLRKWNHLTSDAIATGQKLIVGYLNAADVPNMETVATVSKPEPPKQDRQEVKEVQQQPAPVTAKPEPVAPPKTEEPKRDIAPSRPVQQTSSMTASVQGVGYFKNQFELQSKKYPLSKDQTATAGIFKTVSGWQDGKYYALIDHVEPGTIIRVVNPTNNKSVYAKVLGEMSGIRQNQGLEVRISNAAASALDIADTDKFIVKVNY